MQNEAKTGLARMRHECPHCDGHMMVRTSYSDHPLIRVMYMYCADQFGCGFRGISRVELIKETAPPRHRNPAADVPPDEWVVDQLVMRLQGRPVKAQEKEASK